MQSVVLADRGGSVDSDVHPTICASPTTMYSGHLGQVPSPAGDSPRPMLALVRNRGRVQNAIGPVATPPPLLSLHSIFLCRWASRSHATAMRPPRATG